MQLTSQLAVISLLSGLISLLCKNWSMIFIPNCHWNHTKIEFGMIPVAIWYEYHTSVFAVYIAAFPFTLSMQRDTSLVPAAYVGGTQIHTELT